MIRAILVALEDTAAGEAALRIAASLAGIARAKLQGVFVVDESRFFHLSPVAALAGSLTGQPAAEQLRNPEEVLRLETQVEKAHDATRSLFFSTCSDTSIEGSFVFQIGKPECILTRLARTVDLVIMPHPPREVGGIAQEGSFLSVEKAVNAVLHDAARPVLLVPDRAQGVSLMMIAYDGSAPSERALRMGAEFSRLIDISDIHLVTAMDGDRVGDRVQQSAIDYLSSYDVDVHSVVAQGRAEDVINQTARRVDPSLVVLGAHGSSALIEALFGSTTDYVMHEIQSALLLVA